ncbi:hypothetical protein U1Q18_013226 [Sarracenia purpurea var. burkii]
MEGRCRCVATVDRRSNGLRRRAGEVRRCAAGATWGATMGEAQRSGRMQQRVATVRVQVEVPQCWAAM